MANTTHFNDFAISDEEFNSKWGFCIEDLYRLAVKFYKEKEGKAVHLSYQDKLQLVAYTQQVCHGAFDSEKQPSLGVLDVIGRDRRLQWQSLGDMSKKESMLKFIKLLSELCPHFLTCMEAYKTEATAKSMQNQEKCDKLNNGDNTIETEATLIQQQQKEELLEIQRRQIQDALNKQTFQQFKEYAENQYPGNPEEQAVLIRKLQEQHFHQYMQQLSQQQQQENEDKNTTADNGNREDEENDALIEKHGENKDLDESTVATEDETTNGDYYEVTPASMWTRKDIQEFKRSIRKEGGDSSIRVGHGETVTIRVPTRKDGKSLFWEFATDSYDIGFGIFFEWGQCENSEISVHISESDDDDDDGEYDDDDQVDEDGEEGGLGDLEQGLTAVTTRHTNNPMISVIVPVYRRDCQEEVYAGSHNYPGTGVYLLKFDNSYSFWRSKTLYYRIYYTR